jgi:hypothetical protein
MLPRCALDLSPRAQAAPGRVLLLAPFTYDTARLAQRLPLLPQQAFGCP